MGEKRIYLEYVRYINNIINGERSRGLSDDVDEWGTRWAVSRPDKTRKVKGRHQVSDTKNPDIWSHKKYLQLVTSYEYFSS